VRDRGIEGTSLEGAGMFLGDSVEGLAAGAEQRAEADLLQITPPHPKWWQVQLRNPVLTLLSLLSKVVVPPA
jgi:hypothetical protein